MVLGLLFGMAAVWTISEGVTVLKGGMHSGEATNFDNQNGARGINPKDVLRIARRNGVTPNKNGVLPAEPNSNIMAYVRQYANTEADIREFERQWYLTVKKQLDKKHDKIRTQSKSEYNKTRNYYETCIIPYLGNDTKNIRIFHWFDMPKEMHEQRMEELVNKTVFGKLVKNYSLRKNKDVPNSYDEYYELRVPKDNSISKYQLKELYKLCCSFLGFDHMM